VLLAGAARLEHEQLHRQIRIGVDLAHVLAIQAPLRAAVGPATGRNVTGFASTTSVEEPRFAVEIFKLDQLVTRAREE
jgi:hypothetical protein